MEGKLLQVPNTQVESTVASLDISALRDEHYNAIVDSVRHVHDELMILRVRAEGERPHFVAGQYTLLGLGAWERRIDGITAVSVDLSAAVAPSVKPRKDLSRSLIRRAYSISSPIVDERGSIVTVDETDSLEFFITLVRKPTDDPPVLTPRLFALQPGDRLFLGPHPHGRYTLEGIEPTKHVVFIATGTGEAPHNAMIAELLSHGHQGHIFSVVSAREWRDLAYLDVHRELERQYANYKYFALTTREPENLDPKHPKFIGKQHVQDFFGSGRFDAAAGIDVDPTNTHIFLCGNPLMIGLPTKGRDGELMYPEPAGMVEVLEHQGYTLDEPRHPGNVHFEKYW